MKGSTVGQLLQEDMAQMVGGKKSVLVTGATGYLGQFLVQDLAKTHKVGIVHHSTAAPDIKGDVHHFWADLATGEGLQEAFDTLGPVDVVVNCAAISSPAACERHPEHARSINVPTRLMDSLEIHKVGHEVETLLIQLSTDNVFQGSRPLWTEDSVFEPINAYGRSKREAEEVIQDRWENHIILRSSLIFGPPPPVPVSRQLFLQFIEKTLKAGKPVKFFSDEFRSPIFALDIVKLVAHMVEHCDSPPLHRLYNLGGPERLSRVEMAQTVARVWGYSTAAIQVAETSSVVRENPSPADISMDCSRLAADFPGIEIRSMAAALREMRPAKAEPPVQ